MMIAGSISEEYRCLVEILTCFVCKGLVQQAHICPNCSKFYCLCCINRQLAIEQKCPNCNKMLSPSMLSNCQKLCADLTETLQKVKLRGLDSDRVVSQDKSPYYCYRHKLQKTYYCQTCERPLCSDCSVLTDTHRGHDFIKLSLIKSKYEQKMSQKMDQIITFSANLQKKVQVLRDNNSSKQIKKDDGLAKMESNMKSLRDQLKKNVKKLLNDAEKKIMNFNQTVEFWNQRYEAWMKILKNTSKTKFIEFQYDLMEQGLLKIFSQAVSLAEGIRGEKQIILKSNLSVNYISPDFYNYTFIIQKFSEKRTEQQFFYSKSIVTKEGLELRLKIYPKGIKIQDGQSKPDLKLTKRQSKNQDYFGIFIQLVNGPVHNTKLKHHITLVNHYYDNKQFSRQFESQFDLGLCWGYENYIKLTQLYQDGYYNREFDYIEIVLKIGPCNYFQATKDQAAFLNAKEKIVKDQFKRIEQLQEWIHSKQTISTVSDINLATVENIN